MPDPVVLTISDATVALGDVADPIVPEALTDFKCQLTRAEITSSSNSTTTDRVATFCAPAAQVQVPVASTFTLEMDGFQDWTDAAGVSAWLFRNDATEKAFALYLDDATDPSAVGTIVVQAGSFGGTPREPLTFSVTLPIQGYPDIKDTDGTSIRAAAATGATAGIPGTWTPTGSTPPADVAALIAGTPETVTASPGTAWTTGQYVQTQTAGTGGRAHWSSTAWVAGAAT